MTDNKIMNTALAEVGQRLAGTQRVEHDMTRVLGYSGGVTHLTMDCANSGLACNPITGGALLTFASTRHGYRSSFNELQGKWPQHFITYTPTQNAEAVAREYQGKVDMGFRILHPLKKLPYGMNGDVFFDHADDYFNVLHSPITDCPFELEQPVRFTGEAWAYIPCPTCRLKELKSEACKSRIYTAAAEKGYDADILNDTRIILIDAVEAAIRHTENTIAELESDMKRRLAGDNGRTTRNEVDLIHLRQVHRNVPVEDTAGGINQFAAALTQALNQNSVNQVAKESSEAEILRLKLELAKLEAEKARGYAPVVEEAPVTSSDEILEPLSVRTEVLVNGRAGIIDSKRGGKYQVKFPDDSIQSCDRSELVEKEIQDANSIE